MKNLFWFKGYANFENKRGQWKFYDPQQPDKQVRVATVDWQHNSADDATLKFTNVAQASPGNGDTLTYTVKNTERKIELVDVSESIMAVVFWDAVTTAGYLHVPDYNNGEPAYWDENHDDIEAPA